MLSFRGGNERKVAAHPKIRLYHEHARFTAPYQLTVGAETIESDKIFINTGGRPRVPAIAGLESVGYFTSDTIMDLTTLPEHLIVLGGSYIGLEFGQMFRRFGSQVTVIQEVGQIVPREDPEVAAELQRSLEAEGMKFLLGAGTTRVEKSGNSIRLEMQIAGRSDTVTGSHLLVATGRRPNTDTLGSTRRHRD